MENLLLLEILDLDALSEVIGGTEHPEDRHDPGPFFTAEPVPETMVEAPLLVDRFNNPQP